MERKKNIKQKSNNTYDHSLNSNEVRLPLDSWLDFPQLGEASSARDNTFTKWPIRKSSKACAVPAETQKQIGNETSPLASQKINFSDKKSVVNDATKQKHNVQNVKKSKRPILLDFSAFVKAKEKINYRKSHLKSRVLNQNSTLVGNTLDSSNPLRKKGKCREQKKIKLTKLKTNIIKERILKSMASTNPSIDINNIDFKKEISIYLDNLRKNDKKPNDNAPKHLIGSVPNKHSPFTSKFRWYCENLITKELNEAVSELITRLVNLQDKAFDRDPVRARAHKRFVTGLRETKKYLKLQKVKILIIAPDLETADPNGPLSLYIKELKEESVTKNVTCVFALDRRKLGYCSLRKAPVSVFTVMNYEGAEVEHKNLVTALEEARMAFEKTLNEKNEQIINDLTGRLQFLTTNETVTKS